MGVTVCRAPFNAPGGEPHGDGAVCQWKRKEHAPLYRRKVRFKRTAVLNVVYCLLASHRRVFTGSRDLNPMSQDAHLRPGSFVRRGSLRCSTLERTQHGCRTAFNVSGAHTRVGSLHLVLLGETPGSQDSRAICPPSRQRATGGQRHHDAAIPWKLSLFRGGGARG